ncbi:MAG TPA: sugar ABC transporter permease [Anaerolineales bacterium]|nr:sugar ABC transporter permease [Anaerolineales bacterium]
MKRFFTHHAATYSLLAPYLIGALLLVIIPAGLAFALAFYRYDGLMIPAWRGWGNFIDVAFDPLFWIALANSLFFIVVAVPLRLLAALGLALLYNRPRRGVGVYRAIAYLPSVIPDAAYALVWLWIFNPLYGPLNAILNALGLPTPAWLLEYSLAKPALALMALFPIGEGFVILLAGLKNIPHELYDAAHVDGASRWQAFRRITLPVLTPWLMLLSIRDIILTFQSTFTPAFLMTQGGPYYATLFLPLMVYEEAFEGLRFGIGAAIMLLMFLITLFIILLVYWLFEEGWGYDET